MDKKTYDVLIVGGGTAGVSAAYNCAKLGLSTLLVEKTTNLGGSMTSGMVLPMMNTSHQDINTDFFNELISTASAYGAQNTYSDGNKGWLNPELLKIVLDELLTSVGVNILFETEIVSSIYNESKYYDNVLKQNCLSLHIASKYSIDATGEGIFSKILNCNFLKKENSSQSLTLRFIMTNIDLKAFEKWILNLDKDRNITSSQHTDNQIHLSTAYTWDTNKNWALSPIFEDAVANGELKDYDCSYFQIFTIPGMPTSIAFNCPRIVQKDNIQDVFTKSKALIQGRQQIYRLSQFCKKHFPGFENAYISNISNMLGVRESNRVEGQYVYSQGDIISKKKFDNIALSSDYPIDIHSDKRNEGKLEFIKGNYYLPIESLISSKYDTFYVIGRCLSATFNAQAALRIQQSCFSMGEAVAKHIRQKEDSQKALLYKNLKY